MKESWLKLHTSILHSKKVKRLSPGGRWIYIALLCLAKDCNLNGKIGISEKIPLEIDEIIDEIGVKKQEFDRFFDLAKELNLIEVSDKFIVIPDFQEKQYSKNGRDKRYYDKKKSDKKQAEKTKNSDAISDAHSDKNPTVDYRLQTTDYRDRDQHNIDPEIQKAKDQMAEDLNPLIKAQNILISLGIDKANARRYATRGLSYVQKHVNYWKHEVDEARKTPEECVSWLAARLRDDRAPPLTYIDDCLLPDGTPDFSRMKQSYINQDVSLGKFYYRFNRKGHREYWCDGQFIDEYKIDQHLAKRSKKTA